MGSYQLFLSYFYGHFQEQTVSLPEGIWYFYVFFQYCSTFVQCLNSADDLVVCHVMVTWESRCTSYCTCDCGTGIYLRFKKVENGSGIYGLVGTCRNMQLESQRFL